MSADRWQQAAPWPVVDECRGMAPSQVAKGHTCAQCDGSHDHKWVAWHDGPTSVVLPGWSSVGPLCTAPGIPVRCKHCGGRKCDIDSCMLRRHHRGDHEHY